MGFRGRLSARAQWVLLAAGLTLLAGCGSADPRQQVLEERARWEVELTGWASVDDGITCNVRVSGPVSATLQTLTARFDLVDSSGGLLEQVWEPIDVSSVQRGTPTDLLLKIRTEHADVVDGVGVDVVYAPTPEQEREIPELNR